jgi:hypothetical protein
LTIDIGRYSGKIMAAFLLVEASCVYFLWALNPLSKIGESIFAILLAVDLVSFAVISYVYRAYKNGDPLNRWLLVVACIMIGALIVSAVIV